MKPRAKRVKLRKLADQHREQLDLLQIPLDDILDLVDELEQTHTEFRDKHKTERNLVAAIDSLRSNIQALTLAIDNAVTVLTTPPSGVPEADVQAAADQVAAQTSRLVTATPTTTITPPPPEPVPAPPPPTP